MDERTSEAIENLQTLQGEIDAISQNDSFSEGHTRWLFNVTFALQRYFGTKSDLYLSFMTLTWSLRGGTIIPSPWDLEEQLAQKRKEAYKGDLGAAKGLLSAAIDRLRLVGLDEAQRAAGYAAAASTRGVFISHGGAPPMLAKVERLVRTLGFEPVIVGAGPSLGKSPDDLVPDRMKQCICAIILATRDEANPSSKFPRPNVIHEVGLAQEILKDRIIYLKESGVDFPSNIAPKIWESFDSDNAEPVWDKIVREFRGFGFIA